LIKYYIPKNSKNQSSLTDSVITKTHDDKKDEEAKSEQDILTYKAGY